MLKSPGFWGAVLLLTVLGYFLAPGHTYLQADTQIYVPMMERIYNPVLFADDPMISRPHLALTAYDEIAIALRNYAGLDFEHGLKLLQFLFRACAAAGLLLIASRLGLTLPGAFFVTGLVILNANSLGMPVTDTEPVARSFAFGLLLLSVGLSIEGMFWAAGIAASLGFLIHPTTLAPYVPVAIYVVLRRGARPSLLAPMLPAILAMALLIHFQVGTTEKVDFFGTTDSFQEALQRRYISLLFVTEWSAKTIGDVLLECAVAALGFWRLRGHLKSPLRDWLHGFTGVALLSIPFSFIVVEKVHWAMAGPWSPMRALVFISLLAALFSSACGIFAAQRRAWWEAGLWFTMAMALPVKDQLATWFVNAWLIGGVIALAGAAVAAVWLAGRTKGVSLAVAGMLPFFIFTRPALVSGAPAVDSAELRGLAEWTQSNTPETAVFLFADEGAYGGSGAFRARALRSIYVDYEGRALVNFFPQFSAEWMKRWRDVHEGHWLVTAQDFPDLADKRIDFLVLRTEHAISSRPPEFQNSHYVVYRILQGF